MRKLCVPGKILNKGHYQLSTITIYSLTFEPSLYSSIYHILSLSGPITVHLTLTDLHTSGPREMLNRIHHENKRHDHN